MRRRTSSHQQIEYNGSVYIHFKLIFKSLFGQMLHRQHRKTYRMPVRAQDVGEQLEKNLPDVQGFNRASTVLSI